jgi:hypothetical protein
LKKKDIFVTVVGRGKTAAKEDEANTVPFWLRITEVILYGNVLVEFVRLNGPVPLNQK